MKNLDLTPFGIAITVWLLAAVLAWGPTPHLVAALALLGGYAALLIASMFVKP